MINVAGLIGTHDIVFITLDTLRYDVAVDALERGRTPQLSKRLPSGSWKLRHTRQLYLRGPSGMYEFPSTPARPGQHARLFAARFAGSETTTGHTAVFDAAEWAMRRWMWRVQPFGGVGSSTK